MRTIEGSSGEGGGQILRTALSLAALSGQSIRLINIRARRRSPGLAPQHLTVVKALGQICHAKIKGARLGSTEVIFEPTCPPRAGRYTYDVADSAANGSAGSVTLIAQALLPPLIAAPAESKLQLRGGTHVRWSPSYQYFTSVYAPIWRRLGVHLESDLTAWGFYPAGGGEIELLIQGKPGAPASPLDLTNRGQLLSIEGQAIAANLPAHIPQRMTNRARNLLSELAVPFNVQPRRVRSVGPGAGIFLSAIYEGCVAGFCGHGKPGKPSEQVAEQACRALLNHHATAAVVDPYLADQLLLPLALVAGQSSFITTTVSSHFKTNARVIQQLLPEANISQRKSGELSLVRVHGVGVKTPGA